MANKEAESILRLTHIYIPQCLHMFNTSFLQQDPWRLRLLLCPTKHKLLTMIHIKQLPQDSLIPHFVNTALNGCSGNSFSYD